MKCMWAQFWSLTWIENLFENGFFLRTQGTNQGMWRFALFVFHVLNGGNLEPERF